MTDELRLEYLPLGSLTPDDRNPKDHRLDLIDASFDEFGYTEPVVMDERTGKLLAGHGRVEQLEARRAVGAEAPDGILVDEDGTWFVPVTRGVASKDDDHAAAYLVAANRISEVGGWRDQPLLDLLHNLAETPLFPLTGYTPEDVLDMEALLAPPKETKSHPDDVPEPPTPTTKRGDVWLLGGHTTCPECRHVNEVGAARG